MHAAYYSAREEERGGGSGSLYHAITLCSETWIKIEKSKIEGFIDLNYQATMLWNNKNGI